MERAVLNYIKEAVSPPVSWLGMFCVLGGLQPHDNVCTCVHNHMHIIYRYIRHIEVHSYCAVSRD